MLPEKIEALRVRLGKVAGGVILFSAAWVVVALAAGAHTMLGMVANGVSTFLLGTWVALRLARSWLP